MNKYQEAYSYIKHYCELDDDIIRWPLYQKSINALQELVDKATPKKPLVQKYKYSEHYICPNCNKHKLAIIDYGEYINQLRKGSKLTLYCPECGQALDWSEE